MYLRCLVLIASLLTAIAASASDNVVRIADLTNNPAAFEGERVTVPDCLVLDFNVTLGAKCTSPKKNPRVVLWIEGRTLPQASRDVLAKCGTADLAAGYCLVTATGVVLSADYEAVLLDAATVELLERVQGIQRSLRRVAWPLRETWRYRLRLPASRALRLRSRPLARALLRRGREPYTDAIPARPRPHYPSTAFRRLKHKTQVFIVHEGDHYRTRLTHTIEVAQIARALARALCCDEDLAEAIALVHDFGHTPFGHTGEDALDERLKAWGGFDHNAQSLRIVTKLERRYAEFDGLNLSWETLEGLVKHNGPLIDAAGRGTRGPVAQIVADFDALFDLELDRYASLEAQCAAIADDIAYNSHDIDDGLRAGLLTLPALADAGLPAAILDDVRRRYPALDDVRTGHELMRRQITLMVEDVIASASQALGELKPASSDDIRLAGRPIVAFSTAMAEQERELKAFLYARLYRHPQVMSVRAEAERVVLDLFDAYFADPTLMPEGWREILGRADDRVKARHVADFLAGMTDTYALKEHRRLFDHTPDLG